MKYQYEHFPIMVDKEVSDLLKLGFAYLMGRDRNYRPIFVLKSSRLLSLNPLPTPEVLTKSMLIFFEYVKKFMMINGKIENALLVIDS
tara:strand:- start:447 stop:710 length:264 start_codon:yes stop_codon:yes gene_type:complete